MSTPVDHTTVPAADDTRDLGFGAVVARMSRQRLLNRDGSFNVVRDGLRFWTSLSIYHAFITMSWMRFFGILSAVYLLANIVFGAAYVLCGPGALAAPSSALAYGRFLEAFFFSVETFATIGYGHITPASLAANVLTTVESFVGLLLVALSTGLVFARFSRPTANIIFSERAVIAPYRGITAFQFRIANARSSQIIQLEARVLFSFLEGNDGVRVFRDLTLERQQVVFFPLAWTVVHAITPDSPLHGLTAEDLHQMSAEFLILLTGVDETWAQTVHTRSSYRADEVAWGARFESVFNPPTAEGILSIDMRRLHHIERVDATP